MAEAGAWWLVHVHHGGVVNVDGIYSTAASSGDFPVSVHLMASFTNLARPRCLLLVWKASMKSESFKVVLFSLWVSWKVTHWPYSYLS